jgi:hypothetical protein
MSDWLTQSNNLMMMTQVIVTLVLVPILSYKILVNIAKTYGVNRYPGASDNVEQWLKISSRRYWTIVSITLAVAGSIVLHAIFNGTELLNWDDQSGLMVIYLLSMIPVVIMALMHRALFGIFKKHAGNKRTASLRVRSWKDYISIPLVILIAVANTIFIATVVYFAQHPFDGFAGYWNLFGLAGINVIFIVIIFAVYRDNKTNGLQQPEQRDALKKRSININMLILAIALLHISTSVWIQGTDLVSYKILVQSLYFQVVLVITAFSLTLPKSIFSENV